MGRGTVLIVATMLALGLSLTAAGEELQKPPEEIDPGGGGGGDPCDAVGGCPNPCDAIGGCDPCGWLDCPILGETCVEPTGPDGDPLGPEVCVGPIP